MLAGSLRPRQGADALFADLASAIRDGQFQVNERLAPLTELARRYGIAFTTARAAVGRLEKEGLVQRKRGSGTYVTWQPENAAATAAAATSDMVYLLIQRHTHVYGNLADSVAEQLQDQGKVPAYLAWRPERGIEAYRGLLDAWQSQPPMAIVSLWWEQLEPQLTDAMHRLHKQGTCVIATFSDESRVPPDVHVVGPDREAGLREAAQHLVSLGHRRIGLVTNPRRRVETGDDRLRKSKFGHTPYILALGRTVRETDPDASLTIHYQYQGVNSEPGIEAACRWLDRPDRPTAIVGEDNRLLDVKRAADRLGLRIPDDLMLIGMGNTPWAEAADLTSLSLCEDVIARHVMTILDSSARHADRAVHRIRVHPRLIERGSCPVASHSGAVVGSI